MNKELFIELNQIRSAITWFCGLTLSSTALEFHFPLMNFRHPRFPLSVENFADSNRIFIHFQLNNGGRAAGSSHICHTWLVTLSDQFPPQPLPSLTQLGNILPPPPIADGKKIERKCINVINFPRNGKRYLLYRKTRL